MERWHDFFVAVAGASAALTGLIFVGVSLSLNRMLAIPRLADRASEALILLMTALVNACLFLVPEPSYQWLGTVILAIGVAVWSAIVRLDAAIYRVTQMAYRKHYRWMIPFNQLAVLPYIVTGIITLTHGADGIYFIIPGIIFSFMKSVLDGWVILVEIHR